MISSTIIKMDSDDFSQLATALIDWSSVASPNVLYEQQAPPVVQQTDFMNRSLIDNVKTEITMNPTCEEYSAGAIGTPSFNVEGAMFATSAEQVPMDENDPLESFTFWDGETFYCNQDLENTCRVSPDTLIERDIADIQDYLMQDNSMTKDDLSQIQESDLIRNPTLAELNCSDNIFECSGDGSFLSDDSGYLMTSDMLSKSMPLSEGSFTSPVHAASSSSSIYISNLNNIPTPNYSEPRGQPMLSSSCPVPSRMMSCPQYLSTCDEKLLLCPQNSPASDSFVPRPESLSVDNRFLLASSNQSPIKNFYSDNCGSATAILSSSAPSEGFIDRAEVIKTESPSTSSTGRRSAEKSLSQFSSLSLSNDDESGSYFDDSDREEEDDFSSDEDLYQYESDETFSTSWPPRKESKAQARRHKYFWQYNLQSRGVKTLNLMPLTEEGDPHVLNDVKDPVFSEECTLPVKHSGKARKGDGNDLTPNPRKLYTIGLELKKLNKLIYNLSPNHEFSGHGKPLSRKEKNKLASRVCRLKKKAQHEANKIKLYGLQQEHKRLLTVLVDLKRLLKFKVEHFQESSNVPCSPKMDSYLRLHEPKNVAGNTTEFVNEILEKVAKGEPDGGLGKL